MNGVIVAPATAPGGALGVVRLSGPGSADIVLSFLRPPAPRAGGEPPRSKSLELPERRAVLADAMDGAHLLDRVLAVRFPEGRSYTGEETVELSSHGSPFVMERLAELCCRFGARPARPGEFTQRAFLNGRMDLVQAEAVCDLIASRTRRAHRSASRRLVGGLSRAVERLRGRIVESLALCEAALDHPGEDLPELSGPGLAASLEPVRLELLSLTRAQRRGRLGRDGPRVVLVGRPNAGKSTLFNALLGRERAIVAPRPGTTRDTLEETADLGGICAVLTDTAGLRTPSKGRTPENLGMARAEEALGAADLVLLVLDRSRPLEGQRALLERVAADPDRTALIALNKSDLPRRAFSKADLAGEFPGLDAVEVCALRGEGMWALEERLQALLRGPEREETGLRAASERHLHALRGASAGLEEALSLLSLGREPELAAPRLRDALDSLDGVTGRTTTEDVLGEIFSRFCIGK